MPAAPPAPASAIGPHASTTVTWYVPKAVTESWLKRSAISKANSNNTSNGSGMDGTRGLCCAFLLSLCKRHARRHLISVRSRHAVVHCRKSRLDVTALTTQHRRRLADLNATVRGGLKGPAGASSLPRLVVTTEVSGAVTGAVGDLQARAVLMCEGTATTDAFSVVDCTLHVVSTPESHL